MERNKEPSVFVSPLDRIDMLDRENVKFVQEYWLSGGGMFMQKQQNGREWAYKLPTGEIAFTAVDWQERAPHRYTQHW
jgi:hypothetical protein